MDPFVEISAATLDYIRSGVARPTVAEMASLTSDFGWMMVDFQAAVVNVLMSARFVGADKLEG